MAIYFSEDFDTPVGTPVVYSFADFYAGRGSTWDVEHAAGEGYGGGGAGRWISPAGSVQTAWGLGAQISHTFALGDEFFVRVRYKQDAGQYGWSGDNGNKLFLFGSNTGVESRVIGFQRNPVDNIDFALGGAPNSDPPDYGFDPSVTTWGHASVSGRYVGFDISKGVGGSGSGAGPAFIPPAGDALAPADGWHHIQYAARSGDATTSRLRIWHNNNTEGSPTRQLLGVDGGLGNEGWGGGAFFIIGASWGNSHPEDISFLIDDFELGDTFDSTWYPGEVVSGAGRKMRFKRTN